MKVPVINNSGFPLPIYETKGSAGFDIRAKLPEDACVAIPALGSIRIPTGLYMAIPQGYEVQVRGRSGLAAKYGIGITQGIGTIDSDFRGEICILLTNHSSRPFTVCNGDKIAQGVVAKVEQIEFEVVNKLDKTERGAGGFGSTGK